MLDASLFEWFDQKSTARFGDIVVTLGARKAEGAKAPSAKRPRKAAAVQSNTLSSMFCVQAGVCEGGTVFV